MSNVGKYAKAIVAVSGAILTAVETAFPHDQWVPVINAALTAVAIYLVPNQS